MLQNEKKLTGSDKSGQQMTYGFRKKNVCKERDESIQHTVTTSFRSDCHLSASQEVPEKTYTLASQM